MQEISDAILAGDNLSGRQLYYEKLRSTHTMCVKMHHAQFKTQGSGIENESNGVLCSSCSPSHQIAMKSQLSASSTSPIANEDNITFKSLFRRDGFLKFVFSVFIIDFFYCLSVTGGETPLCVSDSPKINK